MLSGHPHIKKLYIRERFKASEGLHQTLIVETNLIDPSMGNKKDNKEWAALYDYLSALTSNDFVGVKNVELKGKTH